MRKIPWSLFQHLQYCRLDFGHGFVQAVGHFLAGDGYLNGVGGHQVGTTDDEGLGGFLQVGNGCAYADLYLLGSNLTYFDVVLLAHVLLYVGCEHVSGHPDGLAGNDAAKRDDGDL